MNDEETTVQELKELVDKFRQERDWGKHHSGKNLAASIVIEAAELLEHYQWDDYHVPDEGKDVAQAVKKKIAEVSKKYPVGVFNDKKDDPKDYWEIKKKHRADS